jgi:hypothetical protein
MKKQSLKSNVNHSAQSAQQNAAKSNSVLRKLAGKHGQPSQVNKIAPKR